MISFACKMATGHHVLHLIEALNQYVKGVQILDAMNYYSPLLSHQRMAYDEYKNTDEREKKSKAL